ncbi:AraC family transcriptional regulator [Parapedobacter defluvii]|uniref:AraC family transcriptional regulator n=1 Tax=Parapedobacter defluvii TaxID=2045106 RepID=A0ABQ1L2G5_9SPHI|nr:AraC family transcriptional regulator [Parapedobacter defluvii]RQP19236.1 MAG: AraC family transcriptional regulator [Parapedobacter sp.]GGC14024.1 AraC family transcriptional regulator [Parapedobacter defluvii]
MKAVEYRLPKEFDKSFIVFTEQGTYFPCPWHYHPEYEFVLVNRSTGRRMVGDHIGHFDEGDLVFMGPALPHVWVNDAAYVQGQAKQEASAVVVHFVEDFLGENFLCLPEMEPLKKVLDLSKRGLVINGRTRLQINCLMNAMIGESGLKRLSSLFAIFDILAHSTDYEPLASPNYMQHTQGYYSDRYSKITDYILRNFHREITLNEVASEASMATTTFCNFFKEHYRMTFVEYLNTIRIGHVCKLLADSDENVVNIAYECGFNNLANFNRQFKRLKGMSPSEYRRMLELKSA